MARDWRRTPTGRQASIEGRNAYESRVDRVSNAARRRMAQALSGVLFLVALIAGPLPGGAASQESARVQAPSLLGTWAWQDLDELLAVRANPRNVIVFRRIVRGSARYYLRFGRQKPVRIRIKNGAIALNAPRKVGGRRGVVRYTGRVKRSNGEVVLNGRVRFVRPKLAGRSSFRAELRRPKVATAS